MLEIAKEDIVKRLEFDNPWWDVDSDIQVAFEAQPRRQYFSAFFKIVTDLDLRRAVVMMGPRRVGKTVMVYHAIRQLLDQGIAGQNILYLSMETPLYTGLSLEKVLGLFQEKYTHKKNTVLYIFFDEIQYLKNWEIHLKSLVDSYPYYRFVATGSAAAALRLKSVESGAGRFTDFILPPLTFAEYLFFIGKEDDLVIKPLAGERFVFPRVKVKDINDLNHEFVNYLNYGGYPEAVFSETIRHNPEQYIKSDIIDKVLLRDLPSLYGISDIQELNRLFTTLAYNTGNEVSLDGLSKLSGVSKNTLKRYLDYLEAAFLIQRVERIDQNAKRFKRAMCFKVYLNNPSMRAALFGQVQQDADVMGALTETAIFSQWQHGKTSLYYARWSDGEVDIVCLSAVSQKPIWAVEVKWTDRPYRVRAELDRYLGFIEKNTEMAEKFTITSKTIQDDQVIHKDVSFEFVPAALYAYILGNNLLKHANQEI